MTQTGTAQSPVACDICLRENDEGCTGYDEVNEEPVWPSDWTLVLGDPITVEEGRKALFNGREIEVREIFTPGYFVCPCCIGRLSFHFSGVMQ